MPDIILTFRPETELNDENNGENYDQTLLGIHEIIDDPFYLRHVDGRA